MQRNNHYDTVSAAIDALNKQVFIHDFNIHQDTLLCNAERYGADDFEVVDIYRYEGDTDPADEATVYAIQSKNGLKGVLVTGYGISADGISAAILAKLKM